MLASETQEIADCLKDTMLKKYGEEAINKHFADTRDTLCYATRDNQQATMELLNVEADFAIVVGGYNSSNTSHIVELLEENFKTYFVSDQSKLVSKKKIKHFDINTKIENYTENYIPRKDNVNVILTSGASCPDSVVENVMLKLLSYFDDLAEVDEVISVL
jgi:4-hydroxy-3-methylbut-2-enyl diphosphate reductase